METKFTEKESLAIISGMIEQARNNLQKGSGDSMIFYGCMVAFTAILNVILIFTLKDPNQSCWVWCLMIPASIAGYFIKKRVDRDAIVKTHIDRIIRMIWVGFGFSILVFLIILFGYAYYWKNFQMFMLINPIIILITGMGEFITAKACRFKPFVYGAICMWLGALGSLIALFFTGYIVVVQFLILALCMIVGFVIPGYQLNKKAKEHA